MVLTHPELLPKMAKVDEAYWGWRKVYDGYEAGLKAKSQEPPAPVAAARDWITEKLNEAVKSIKQRRSEAGLLEIVLDPSRMPSSCSQDIDVSRVDTATFSILVTPKPVWEMPAPATDEGQAAESGNAKEGKEQVFVQPDSMNRRVYWRWVTDFSTGLVTTSLGERRYFVDGRGATTTTTNTSHSTSATTTTTTTSASSSEISTTTGDTTAKTTSGTTTASEQKTGDSSSTQTSGSSNTKVVRQGASSGSDFGAGVLGQLYLTTPLGLSIGPCLGVTASDSPRILAGGSVVVAVSHRVRVSASYGTAWGKVTRLSGDVLNGDQLTPPVYAIGDTPSTASVTETGHFWAFTAALSF